VPQENQARTELEVQRAQLAHQESPAKEAQGVKLALQANTEPKVLRDQKASRDCQERTDQEAQQVPLVPQVKEATLELEDSVASVVKLAQLVQKAERVQREKLVKLVYKERLVKEELQERKV